MSTKKGQFRKIVRVEMLETVSALKKGVVTEMHPVLANRLIAANQAKKSSKELSSPAIAPMAKINESNA